MPEPGALSSGRYGWVGPRAEGRGRAIGIRVLVCNRFVARNWMVFDRSRPRGRGILAVRVGAVSRELVALELVALLTQLQAPVRTEKRMRERERERECVTIRSAGATSPVRLEAGPEEKHNTPSGSEACCPILEFQKGKVNEPIAVIDMSFRGTLLSEAHIEQ